MNGSGLAIFSSLKNYAELTMSAFEQIETIKNLQQLHNSSLEDTFSSHG